ncbi:MAG: hypothetical protein ACRDHP_18640, partial [Ktedonobacterales bacterium]
MAESSNTNAAQNMATGGVPDTGETTHPSDAGQPGDRSRRVRARASRQRVLRQAKDQQWRDEFPYHWSADDLVTRRDTLR